MSKVIAIDGTAAAGKGTLARALAHALDFAYLDTGALYRAVALKAAAAGAVADAAHIAEGLEPLDLNHPDLRRAETGELASQVAAQRGVRQALLAFQRRFGRNPPAGKAGAVLDGRDIGTVIFPDADLKLYISASTEVRARRRFDELPPATRPPFATVLAQVRARDAHDLGRQDAPLAMAADAHAIDTSVLNAAQVLKSALSIWRESR